MAALSGHNVITQWRLGLLDCEEPSTVDQAYSELNHSITSAEALQIIRNKHEKANIRFALTVMLSERGDESLLSSARVAPLKHPAFFGDDHLAQIARQYDYPIAVTDFLQKEVPVEEDFGACAFLGSSPDWPKVPL